MALPPKLSGARLILPSSSSSTSSTSTPLHTIELYLDYVCPYSAKIFKTLHHQVLPSLPSQYAQKTQFIIRQQIQPWHPSSTLVHEAALAVNRLSPQKFWDFSSALFDSQKDYFDVNVVNETRNATYRRLAKLARESVGVDEEQVYKLLEISDKPAEDGSLNTGNAVTADVKLVVKSARLVGVHVSPTVIVNGVVDNSISSGWGVSEWGEWFNSNIY
ncbi:thioredoxin-like protein [Cladorrhinum sp. PSN259]|nr:thioredoxin-like protein [Cladorrhinum sp. PSN259]